VFSLANKEYLFSYVFKHQITVISFSTLQTKMFNIEIFGYSSKQVSTIQQHWL